MGPRVMSMASRSGSIATGWITMPLDWMLTVGLRWGLTGLRRWKESMYSTPAWVVCSTASTRPRNSSCIAMLKCSDGCIPSSSNSPVSPESVMRDCGSAAVSGTLDTKVTMMVFWAPASAVIWPMLRVVKVDWAERPRMLSGRPSSTVPSKTVGGISSSTLRPISTGLIGMELASMVMSGEVCGLLGFLTSKRNDTCDGIPSVMYSVMELVWSSHAAMLVSPSGDAENTSAVSPWSITSSPTTQAPSRPLMVTTTSQAAGSGTLVVHLTVRTLGLDGYGVFWTMLVVSNMAWKTVIGRFSRCCGTSMRCMSATVSPSSTIERKGVLAFTAVVGFSTSKLKE
mmetsp:Transcript_36103/g.72416  ORF Transcript_36103/g.72416 Transcript_36103/m.72416 type:complete len:341 (-) Transcript_36103:3849-4871(-)